MSGATPARPSSIAGSSVIGDALEISHVLDGAVLDGAARRLARMLDRGFGARSAEERKVPLTADAQVNRYGPWVAAGGEVTPELRVCVG
ncbi:MAG: hypothetical protein ACRDQU_19740 [Pseudonocardiaceae bacterium]